MGINKQFQPKEETIKEATDLKQLFTAFNDKDFGFDIVTFSNAKNDNIKTAKDTEQFGVFGATDFEAIKNTAKLTGGKNQRNTLDNNFFTGENIIKSTLAGARTTLFDTNMQQMPANIIKGFEAAKTGIFTAGKTETAGLFGEDNANLPNFTKLATSINLSGNNKNYETILKEREEIQQKRQQELQEQMTKWREEYEKQQQEMEKQRAERQAKIQEFIKQQQELEQKQQQERLEQIAKWREEYEKQQQEMENTKAKRLAGIQELLKANNNDTDNINVLLNARNTTGIWQ